MPSSARPCPFQSKLGTSCERNTGVRQVNPLQLGESWMGRLPSQKPTPPLNQTTCPPRHQVRSRALLHSMQSCPGKLATRQGVPEHTHLQTVGRWHREPSRCRATHIQSLPYSHQIHHYSSPEEDPKESPLSTTSNRVGLFHVAVPERNTGRVLCPKKRVVQG